MQGKLGSVGVVGGDGVVQGRKDQRWLGKGGDWEITGAKRVSGWGQEAGQNEPEKARRIEGGLCCFWKQSGVVFCLFIEFIFQSLGHGVGLLLHGRCPMAYLPQPPLCLPMLYKSKFPPASCSGPRDPPDSGSGVGGG